MQELEISNYKWNDSSQMEHFPFLVTQEPDKYLQKPRKLLDSLLPLQLLLTTKMLYDRQSTRTCKEYQEARGAECDRKNKSKCSNNHWWREAGSKLKRKILPSIEQTPVYRQQRKSTGEKPGRTNFMLNGSAVGTRNIYSLTKKSNNLPQSHVEYCPSLLPYFFFLNFPFYLLIHVSMLFYSFGVCLVFFPHTSQSIQFLYIKNTCIFFFFYCCK